MNGEEKNGDRLHGVFERPMSGIVAFMLILGPTYLAWGGFAAFYCAVFAGLLVLTVQNSVADREVFRRILKEHGSDHTYENRRMIFRGQWGVLLGLSGFGPVIYAACYFTIHYLMPDTWSAWEKALAEIVDWCASMVPNAEIFARTVASRGYPERAPIIEHLMGVGFFLGLLFGACGIARALVLATCVRFSRRDMSKALWVFLGGILIACLGIWAAFYGLKLDWNPGIRHITLHRTWFSIYYLLLANLLIYLGLSATLLSFSAWINSQGEIDNG